MFYDIFALFILLLMISLPVTAYFVDRWGFNHLHDR
jgi:hypothetical protein